MFSFTYLGASWLQVLVHKPANLHESQYQLNKKTLQEVRMLPFTSYLESLN